MVAAEKAMDDLFEEFMNMKRGEDENENLHKRSGNGNL